MLCALLAGCSQGPSADLQYIKQARSIGAEWALVNEQANKGSLTPIYVHSMREWLHQDLQSAQSSLTQAQSPYGQEIEALLAEQPEAEPGRLRAHVERLKQIEDGLESA